MNRMCRVWNGHDREYVEEFKGDMIRIPAEGTLDDKGCKANYVSMDYSEASQFLTQFNAPKLLGNGLQDPVTMKRLKVEVPAFGAELPPLEPVAAPKKQKTA